MIVIEPEFNSNVFIFEYMKNKTSHRQIFCCHIEYEDESFDMISNKYSNHTPVNFSLKIVSLTSAESVQKLCGRHTRR